jgi:outer membrane immunogenic protein
MRVSFFGAALAALTFCSPAMASNTGPYVGVGVTHDNVASAGDLEGAGVNGIGGTVFVGFDFPVGDKLFLGVDANFDVSSAKAGDSDFGAKAKNSFGSSARLGINVNDSTALYGRMGYQRGRASSSFDGETDSGSLDGMRFWGRS